MFVHSYLFIITGKFSVAIQGEFSMTNWTRWTQELFAISIFTHLHSEEKVMKIPENFLRIAWEFWNIFVVCNRCMYIRLCLIPKKSGGSIFSEEIFFAHIFLAIIFDFFPQSFTSQIRTVHLSQLLSQACLTEPYKVKKSTKILTLTQGEIRLIELVELNRRLTLKRNFLYHTEH